MTVPVELAEKSERATGSPQERWARALAVYALVGTAVNAVLLGFLVAVIAKWGNGEDLWQGPLEYVVLCMVLFPPLIITMIVLSATSLYASRKKTRALKVSVLALTSSLLLAVATVAYAVFLNWSATN